MSDVDDSSVGAFDLDLDSVSRPDIHVKLGGLIWRMPGGPRSETVVDLAALFQAYDKALAEEEPDQLKQVSDEIRDIIVATFDERPQDHDMSEFPTLDDEQLAALFKMMVDTIKHARLERLEALREAEAAAEESGSARPTGSTSTPRQKSARRSPRSSAKSKRRPSSAASS